MSTTQQLNQTVLQRYGWSAVFDRDVQGHWLVTITMGFVGNAPDRRTFTTTCSSTDEKQGIQAASAMALEGLREQIQREESKPKQDLMQTFQQHAHFQILDSFDPRSWQRVWSNPPSCVGIDVEGNQKSPPVLVQIATEDFCILEVPRNGRLSNDLNRLLTDDSIQKIFCDNYSHHDKTSLGLSSPAGWAATTDAGIIVDLELLAAKHLGPVKVPRGLGRIATLCMPELANITITKPKHNNPSMKGRFANIGRFALIEQGKLPPLRGIGDLSAMEQRYAALDAWVTLQCYKRFSCVV